MAETKRRMQRKDDSAVTDEDVMHAAMHLVPLLTQKIVEPFRNVRPDNLTFMQLQTMYIIYEKGEIRMSVLADILNMKKQQLTPIAAYLTDCGYIRKRKDPDNRRVTLVSLTEEGYGVLDEVDGELLKALAPMFDALGDADRRALYQSATKMAEILDKMMPSKSC